MCTEASLAIIVIVVVTTTRISFQSVIFTQILRQRNSLLFLTVGHHVESLISLISKIEEFQGVETYNSDSDSALSNKLKSNALDKPKQAMLWILAGENKLNLILRRENLISGHGYVHEDTGHILDVVWIKDYILSAIVAQTQNAQLFV